MTVIFRRTMYECSKKYSLFLENYTRKKYGNALKKSGKCDTIRNVKIVVLRPGQEEGSCIGCTATQKMEVM